MMYVIKRSDELFLCDGAVYVNSGRTLPQPVWQELEGTRNLYLEVSLHYITKRKERLEKIYIKHKLTVIKLSEQELEYLTFRKLRGY
ncbi:MAG TPA: hypothetical protein VIY47_06160 [Ignavibacteriaceae bacterium]